MGTTVGLPGVIVGVPLAPGTELILIVICAASGNVVLPLKITIVTLLTPGCFKGFKRKFIAFCLLMPAMSFFSFGISNWL